MHPFPHGVPTALQTLVWDIAHYPDDVHHLRQAMSRVGGTDEEALVMILDMLGFSMEQEPPASPHRPVNPEEVDSLYQTLLPAAMSRLDPCNYDDHFLTVSGEEDVQRAIQRATLYVQQTNQSFVCC